LLPTIPIGRVNRFRKSRLREIAMRKAQMKRTTLPVWCAATLLLVACGGGGGADTSGSGDVAETADVQEGADIGIDSVEDADEPLPEDLLPEAVDPDLTDAVDPETDSIEPDADDIWPDESDVPEDIFCESPPMYPDNCLEVSDFQCGFEAQCSEGVITILWHEHVFCGDVEEIVDYTCTYECPGECDEAVSEEWLENGKQVLLYCQEGGCAPPESYAIVPLGAILAEPEAFDDTLVALEEVVVAGAAPMCTLAECTPEDPCCNGCAVDYSIAGAEQLVTIVAGDVSNVGCSGTNCDSLDNCTPFALDQTHLLWGGLQSNGGQITIYLDGYCEN